MNSSSPAPHSSSSSGSRRLSSQDPSGLSPMGRMALDSPVDRSSPSKEHDGSRPQHSSDGRRRFSGTAAVPFSFPSPSLSSGTLTASSSTASSLGLVDLPTPSRSMDFKASVFLDSPPSLYLPHRPSPYPSTAVSLKRPRSDFSPERNFPSSGSALGATGLHRDAFSSFSLLTSAPRLQPSFTSPLSHSSCHPPRDLSQSPMQDTPSRVLHFPADGSDLALEAQQLSPAEIVGVLNELRSKDGDCWAGGASRSRRESKPTQSDDFWNSKTELAFITGCVFLPALRGSRVTFFGQALGRMGVIASMVSIATGRFCTEELAARHLESLLGLDGLPSHLRLVLDREPNAVAERPLAIYRLAVLVNVAPEILHLLSLAPATPLAGLDRPNWLVAAEQEHASLKTVSSGPRQSPSKRAKLSDPRELHSSPIGGSPLRRPVVTTRPSSAQASARAQTPFDKAVLPSSFIAWTASPEAHSPHFRLSQGTARSFHLQPSVPFGVLQGRQQDRLPEISHLLAAKAPCPVVHADVALCLPQEVLSKSLSLVRMSVGLPNARFVPGAASITTVRIAGRPPVSTSHPLVDLSESDRSLSPGSNGAFGADLPVGALGAVLDELSSRTHEAPEIRLERLRSVVLPQITIVQEIISRSDGGQVQLGVVRHSGAASAGLEVGDRIHLVVAYTLSLALKGGGSTVFRFVSDDGARSSVSPSLALASGTRPVIHVRAASRNKNDLSIAVFPHPSMHSPSPQSQLLPPLGTDEIDPITPVEQSIPLPQLPPPIVEDAPSRQRQRTLERNEAYRRQNPHHRGLSSYSFGRSSLPTITSPPSQSSSVEQHPRASISLARSPAMHTQPLPRSRSASQRMRTITSGSSGSTGGASVRPGALQPSADIRSSNFTSTGSSSSSSSERAYTLPPPLFDNVPLPAHEQSLPSLQPILDLPLPRRKPSLPFVPFPSPSRNDRHALPVVGYRQDPPASFFDRRSSLDASDFARRHP